MPAAPLSGPEGVAHNIAMQRHVLQLSVSTLLLLVAAAALNIWLFRVGPLAGLLGLSVTKHVLIAWLCQVLGVNRRHARPIPEVARPSPYRKRLIRSQS
ncbi:hypothetical protein BH23PLA1_BH23PLA1_29000 [soil metagenome]